jgi:cation transporter-like permease
MLNQAYDALMDLAAIIGVPPKAISLNGSLGLAFGARGSGNYAAHYEPDTLVINLTTTKGAGTLAHEWFHALDK